MILIIADSVNAPEIGVTRQQFGLYNVTITLSIQNISAQNASYYGALYNTSLSVTPDPIASDSIRNSADDNCVQLMLLYNTRYSISAVTTLCTESSHPNIIEQYYGESSAWLLI
jgi:hypothetical protein